MIIDARSYPHPVLAPFSDDVIPNEFGLRLTTTFDADNYYLEVAFDYENATITELVESGRATHVVHVECKRNFFREIFAFASRSNGITVRASELVGTVEVSAFIKATQEIEDYTISGAHADYAKVTFRLRIGDPVAVAESQTFDAYNDYDPLRTVSSILTIRMSDTEDDGPMIIDTTADRIVATLSRNDYGRYTDLAADPNLGPLLANQVVVPALLQGVFEMSRTSEDDLETEMALLWFRSIQKRLEELGIDVRNGQTEPIDAVQRILMLPLRRSLEGLMQSVPLEEEA